MGSAAAAAAKSLQSCSTLQPHRQQQWNENAEERIGELEDRQIAQF